MPEPESAAIEVRNLSKVFGGEIRAVDGISFVVHPREIFGFTGPNGAGKTTTIDILTTQSRPTSGTARVVGYDVLKNPNEVRKRISVVPQNSSADEELTGRENAEVVAGLYGIPRRESGRIVTGVLELVELADAADRLVRTYSGGMRRRLEIACGLISRPNVLFLDEPTLGLDAQTRHAVWRYVRNLKEEHSMTIFLTTHYLEEAEQLCDRVAIIDRGKIVRMGTPDEIKRVVGGDVIELAMDVGNDDISRAISESVAAQVERTGSTYRIKVRKGEDAIPSIIELIGSKGYKVKSVSLSKPSLAQAYLEVTGRAFREEDPRAEDSARMMRMFS